MTHHNKMQWDISPSDPMIVKVWESDAAQRQGDAPLLSMFVGEIIEAAGRRNVMQHVKHCDQCAWLTNWNPAKQTFNTIKHSR